MRALDLFCGAGGLTLGLRGAGVETVCAVDCEPHRLRTFRVHTARAVVLNADVRSLDFRVYRGEVDIVCGGPPCQPFSSGGLRAAAGDERDMLPEYVRAVREVRPRAFLMENVPGLAVGKRGEYLRSVLGSLEAEGYVVTWQVLNAADYGVPQLRKRLFVLGAFGRRLRFPEPTHGPGLLSYVSAAEALRDVGGEPNRAKVVYAKRPDLRPSPFDGHLFNGGGRPIDLTRPCRTILAAAGGNKTHFVDELRLVPPYHEHLRKGGAPYRGELPGGRRLTVEESAAIQTFPRALEFKGPRSARYHQIGDAVPPRLGKVLGLALVEQLRAA